MHSVAQFGSDIPSIRQVTHRSHHFTLLLPNSFPAVVLVLVPLPKLCTSKIRYSRVENRDSILYSGKEKVAVRGTTDAIQELQAAENRQFWITTTEGTPEKRPNYKETLEASQPP